MRKRYDGRLLLAHLGRLDKLAHKRSAQEAAMFFDMRLERLSSGEMMAQDAADGGEDYLS